MPIPSLTQWARLQELMDGRVLERLAALEARQAKEGPGPLRERNATRAADGARLRRQIGAVLAEQPEATAKHVLRDLEQAGVTPLPSDRTVRWHMAALRGNGNTAHCHRGG